MSKMSTLLYGELDDLICVLDSGNCETQELECALLNLARHIQGIEKRLERAEGKG